MTLPKNQSSTLNELNDKIDRLYEMIEQLNVRLSDVLASSSASSKNQAPASFSPVGNSPFAARASSSFDQEMIGHKDVLSEGDFFESNRTTGDQALTAEIQIQRLTAQLTAAYNRIAALEEQLLAHRIQ